MKDDDADLAEEGPQHPWYLETTCPRCEWDIRIEASEKPTLMTVVCPKCKENTVGSAWRKNE